MNRNIIIMLAILVFSKTVLACNWSVTVLEEDNTVVSKNLGFIVPERTPFEIPGIASCNVINDGNIYTTCTYNKTNNSVVVTPLNDKDLGQMSNMMIFEGNIEDNSKKYLVVTMCSGS